MYAHALRLLLGLLLDTTWARAPACLHRNLHRNPPHAQYLDESDGDSEGDELLESTGMRPNRIVSQAPRGGKVFDLTVPIATSPPTSLIDAAAAAVHDSSKHDPASSSTVHNRRFYDDRDGPSSGAAPASAMDPAATPTAVAEWLATQGCNANASGPIVRVVLAQGLNGRDMLDLTEQDIAENFEIEHPAELWQLMRRPGTVGPRGDPRPPPLTTPAFELAAVLFAAPAVPSPVELEGPYGADQETSCLDSSEELREASLQAELGSLASKLEASTHTASELKAQVDGLRVQLRLTEAASTDNGQAAIEREALGRKVAEAVEAAASSQARVAELESTLQSEQEETSRLRLRLNANADLETKLQAEQAKSVLLQEQLDAPDGKLDAASSDALEAAEAKLQAELAETARLRRLLEAQESLDTGMAKQLAAGAEAGDGRNSAAVLDELNAALRSARELAQVVIDLKAQLAVAHSQAERVPSLESQINSLEQQAAIDKEQLGRYQALVAEHGKTSTALTTALEKISSLETELATAAQGLEQQTCQSESTAAAAKAKLDDALGTIENLKTTVEKLRTEAKAARQKRDAEDGNAADSRLKNVADMARLDKIIKSQGTEIASMMKDASQATKETKRVQGLVDEKTAAISKLQNKYSDSEAALATLREENGDAVQLIAELEKNEQDLQEELGENLERSRLNMSMQVAQVGQLKTVLEEEKAKVPELEQMLRKESAVHQDIADVRAAKIAELNSMLEELQGAHADLDSAKVRIATLENTLNTTAASKSQLQDEVVRLMAALEASKNFVSAESARPMPETFADFEASLDEQIEANQIDTKWLKGYIVMKDDHMVTEITIAQNEAEALTKAAEQAHREYTAIRAELNQLEASRDESERVLAALTKHDAAAGRLVEAHAQLTKVTEALASAQAELAPATAERDQLKTDLSAQSTALQSAQERLQEQLKKAEGTERKLEQTAARVDGLKVEITHLKAEIDRLVSTHAAKEDSSDVKAELAASGKEMRTLRNELAHVNAELSSADEAIARLRQDDVALRNYHNELAHVNAELSSADETIARLRQDDVALRNCHNELAHVHVELSTADETIAQLRQDDFALRAANAELADSIQGVTVQTRALDDDDADSSSDDNNDHARRGPAQFSWVGLDIERAFASPESWLRSTSFGSTANSVPIHLLDSPFHSGEGEATLALTLNALRIVPSWGEVVEWQLDAMTHYAYKGGVVMLQLDDGTQLSFRVLDRQ